MQTFFKTDFKNSCSLFLAMDAASINKTVWFLYSSKKFSKMLFDDNLQKPISFISSKAEREILYSDKNC